MTAPPPVRNGAAATAPVAAARKTAEAAPAAATSGDDAAAPALAAPPRKLCKGGYNEGYCIPACGRAEKKKKKKKKTTPAERGAAKTKTANADPPLDIERIHHLLGTLCDVTEWL